MSDEEREQGAEERQVPIWVYLLLLLFLAAVLLGVESVLNRLLPAR
ncbi:MAG: hypothetical protein ACOY93_04250 [Bacillota bacterium]